MYVNQGKELSAMHEAVRSKSYKAHNLINNFLLSRDKLHVMPRYHGKRKRSTKRRPWFKRNAVPQPFPANRKVTLKYVSNFILDPSGATPSPSYVFRAASIWDPDSTGIGHQPWGRDLYATLYNRYTVLSSRISIRAIQSATSIGIPTIWGVQLSEDGTFDPDPVDQVMENPYVSWRWHQTAVNGNVAAPATMTYSLRKYFGVKDPEDVNMQYGADIGSDPTFAQPYFLVWMRPHDDLADIPSCNFVATITYNVLFSGPNWDGLS
ncbi:MAG: capsid protein [Wigfec virus K19_576]|nr:MAG: capsid protein [Wigfec virus K19_576]